MSRVSLILTGVVAWSATAVAQSTLFERDRDPVVITGQALPALLGTPVANVVAFAHDGVWQQIPVQIDERKYADFGAVYNEAPVGMGIVAYADAATYTGADSDPSFDSDDELVFMAKDAGGRAAPGAGLPAGVVPGGGLEVLVSDPLDAGAGYVYLFVTDGALVPDAGQDYASYSFNLLAGPYIPNYSTLVGPNPENSVAVTAFYRTHFSDRWIRDEINVFAGAASGVDILDRHKITLSPGNCGRTEQTFSNGEGAFFANVDGPVRAIRSYMGSNSGPTTQRDHFFYAQRHDVVSYLRVHAGIPGPLDFFDYSPSAVGMTYHNDLNVSGVPIDGVPDLVIPGLLSWEMVTGAQGTLIISHALETDIDPISVTSYYSDDTTPSVTQCTGDGAEYASSGPWIDQVMPNTDPALGPHNNLTSRRSIYFEAPGQSTTTAALRHAQAQAPLTVSTVAYPYAPGDFDGDGQVGISDYLHFAECLAGPSVLPSPPPPKTAEDCRAIFDFDMDQDVDLCDFAVFQVIFGS